jgi:hypothetical protein
MFCFNRVSSVLFRQFVLRFPRISAAVDSSVNRADVMSVLSRGCVTWVSVHGGLEARTRFRPREFLRSVVRRRRVNDKVSHAHLCSFPLLIAYWVINNYQ